jgi:hypothetical protein
VYLDDHYEVQELSEDLPECKKSSVVEAHALRKLGQVFMMGKGRAEDPTLVLYRKQLAKV